MLRGIRVLAVGTNLENPTATPSAEEASALTVTLEVTPKQADMLAWADQNATLRLALRSPREPIRSEPEEALDLEGPVPPVPAPAPSVGLPSPLTAAATGPKMPYSPVELIVGDEIVNPGKSH